MSELPIDRPCVNISTVVSIPLMAEIEKIQNRLSITSRSEVTRRIIEAGIAALKKEISESPVI